MSRMKQFMYAVINFIAALASIAPQLFASGFGWLGGRGSDCWMLNIAFKS